ncbi:Crp/Fnr family transcriptional regulator [Vallitalea okinawensis]|uniref:Crp/Fnr family transcriptional regulator n=1 Tax=Vallitalea okinawensis TaxID=2078660 RepID=UPI000CFC8114|nr:Crp/Fnr family transcriptional regulator [Vallitalea okinawensis]
MTQNKIKCMKDLEIFSALDDSEKKMVVRFARPVFFKKGQSIFMEGMPCDKIYFIRSGRILLYKVSVDGKEMSLDILKGDDIFGENTIFDESLHSFSAKALEDTFVCVCTKDDFLELLKNPMISLKIIKQLTNKLNAYTEHMANIAFNDVKGRILNIIKKLVDEHGEPTESGTKINIILSHQDIANLVNASRVMVTNIINSLKGDGIILVKSRYIYIPDNNNLEMNY